MMEGMGLGSINNIRPVGPPYTNLTPQPPRRLGLPSYAELTVHPT